MRDKYFVWLLSIGILFTVIIIGVVARKSLSNYGKAERVMASTHIAKAANDKSFKETYNLDSYLIYIQEYIRVSEVNLNAEDESKKESLFRELVTIASLEKNSMIQEMSIDGREMAISLLKNLYGIYGINILFGLDGEIQRVYDSLGNLIYKNADSTLRIVSQLSRLAIVICINLILFVLSIFIGRKSKISLKNGDIYGLDEKKYA